MAGATSGRPFSRGPQQRVSLLFLSRTRASSIPATVAGTEPALSFGASLIVARFMGSNKSPGSSPGLFQSKNILLRQVVHGCRITHGIDQAPQQPIGIFIAV